MGSKPSGGRIAPLPALPQPQSVPSFCTARQKSLAQETCATESMTWIGLSSVTSPKRVPLDVALQSQSVPPESIP